MIAQQTAFRLHAVPDFALCHVRVEVNSWNWAALTVMKAKELIAELEQAVGAIEEVREQRKSASSVECAPRPAARSTSSGAALSPLRVGRVG